MCNAISSLQLEQMTGLILLIPLIHVVSISSIVTMSTLCFSEAASQNMKNWLTNPQLEFEDFSLLL